MSEDLLEQSDIKLSFVELSPVLIPYFLAFFMYRGIFTNFPLFIQITQHLSDVETVQIWAIISGIALFIGALTRLPAGLLSDKIGRVPAFIIAYSVYFVALIFVLLVTNNIIYIIAMGLIRFGSNMVAMTGRAIVSTALRDRALKNGLLSAMVGLGSFIGPYSLGYILDHFQPLAIIYASLFVVSLDLLLFFVLYWRVNSWIDQQPALVKDLDYTAVINTESIEPISALKTRGVPEMLFLFFMIGFVYGLISSIYSIYGYNIVGLSFTTIGLITGLGSLVQTIYAPLTGRLYLYFKDEYLRILAWIYLFVATILASLSPYATIFFILSYVVLNFGHAGYTIVEITRMSRFVKKHQFSFVFGVGSSLFILGTSIAGFISPLLYNIIPEMNFYISLGSTCIGLVIAIISGRKWGKIRQLEQDSS